MRVSTWFTRVVFAASLLLLAPPVDASPVGSYTVGPNYHATTADFVNASFIKRYNSAGVRATVVGQLQTMANDGASVIKTTLWQVGGKSTASWQLSFPLSSQELANIQTYAQDVAATRRPDGQYLDLELTMMWLGCADYTKGSYLTKVGQCGYSWSKFTTLARTSIAGLVQRLAGIRRIDGRPAVVKLYLDGEVMVGAKANQDRFLSDLFPYLLAQTTQAGLDGSIYFSIVPGEADILDNTYVDDQYPELNGHKSLFWIYRSLMFLSNQNLPLPERFDFSFYPEKQTASYSQLVNRVMDDFQAVFPGRRGAVVETSYPLDPGPRTELGQALGAAYLARGIPEQVSFWTTPYQGVAWAGPPFDMAAFELKVADGTQSDIIATPAGCLVPPGDDGCSSTLTWSTTAPSATAAVWMLTGAGDATLVACGKSGQVTTPRILLGSPYTFSLYATPMCGGGAPPLNGVRLASVDVSASYATSVPLSVPPPAPTVPATISASPNPCLLNGSSTCATTISWHAAVLSGTARVFVQPGSGAPVLFACGIDGVQQASWIQRQVAFTFFVDAAPACDSTPPNATLASVVVTAQ